MMKVNKTLQKLIISRNYLQEKIIYDIGKMTLQNIQRAKRLRVPIYKKTIKVLSPQAQT